MHETMGVPCFGVVLMNTQRINLLDERIFRNGGRIFHILLSLFKCSAILSSAKRPL